MLASLLRALLALLVLCATPAAWAQADLTGWWRAEITRHGETEPLYLRFGANADGAPRVRFSIPVARMFDSPGGAYEVDGEQVRLTHLGGARFTLSADGQALEGVIPAGYITPDEFAARFVRAEPPEQPAPPLPLGPAPSPVWSVSVGAPVWAGLVLDGNRALYVAGDDGRLTALAPRDGAQRWQAQIGAPVRATPTLHRGRLFVATDAALVALDARNGREIWRAPFGAERAPRLPIADQNSKWDHYSSSAVVDGDLVVVGARDGCVHALDARTGAQRWRNCTDDLITATPAMTPTAVYYAGFDGSVYGVARDDGRELWRYDSRQPIPRDVVLANGNVIVGSRSYDLIALNAETGAPAWVRHVWYSWIDSPPVLADGLLYLGTSDAMNVFAFDAATGARAWAAPVPGWSWPKVAVGADVVFASVLGGPYISPRAGGLAAIDRANGTLLWFLEAAPPEGGELYGFGAGPTVSRDMVFAADLTGRVYAFAAARP